MMLDSPGRGPSKLVKNGKYLSYHKKVTQLGNTLSKNRDNMTKRQANSANKNNSIMSFSKLLNANQNTTIANQNTTIADQNLDFSEPIQLDLQMKEKEIDQNLKNSEKLTTKDVVLDM